MYRLTARPFLAMGKSVAIVGYRNYPDADVNSQVSDVERAMVELFDRCPDLMHNVTIMGHSSGAHIGMLLLIELVKKRNENNIIFSIKEFVGISGVYGIDDHFAFEANRGVEEVSPLKPACGNTHENFARCSPDYRLRNLVKTLDKGLLFQIFPRILFIHGMEDSTVPFTATSKIAACFRSCGIEVSERYHGKVGHQDAIMDVMFGGIVCESLINWLKSNGEITVRSKL